MPSSNAVSPGFGYGCAYKPCTKMCGGWMFKSKGGASTEGLSRCNPPIDSFRKIEAPLRTQKHDEQFATEHCGKSAHFHHQCEQRAAIMSTCLQLDFLAK